jgi:hypothetical protein
MYKLLRERKMIRFQMIGIYRLKLKFSLLISLMFKKKMNKERSSIRNIFK